MNARKLAPTCRYCGESHSAPEPRCARHNGWSNYETWAVNLWLSNDAGSAAYWEAAAEEARGNARPVFPGANTDRARGDLARRLKSKVEEAAPDLGASLYSNLLSAALSEVDWYEIAGAMLDALPVPEPEEAEAE